MILCAGLGTRLRPLSSWRPKALVPVGDRTVLEHALERVHGVPGPVVVNAHHRAEDLREFVRGHQDLRVRAVQVLEEPTLLGTAGGLANARATLGDGEVLVWTGDIVTSSFDGQAVLAAHRAGAFAATLAVTPGPAGSGNVGIDAGGTVVRLRSETVRPGEARGGWFAAVHVLGSRLLDELPGQGCLVGDLYLPALRRGATFGVLEVGEWKDVGDVKSYLDTNLVWLAARGATSWTGEGARIAPGVQLDRSVIGEGAEVVGEGRLERCVVWPGARAVAPLVDAVVAREGMVYGANGGNDSTVTSPPTTATG
jgi:mannose-1-phosphate guanylyltransferase